MGDTSYVSMTADHISLLSSIIAKIGKISTSLGSDSDDEGGDGVAGEKSLDSELKAIDLKLETLYLKSKAVISDYEERVHCLSEAVKTERQCRVNSDKNYRRASAKFENAITSVQELQQKFTSLGEELSTATSIKTKTIADLNNTKRDLAVLMFEKKSLEYENKKLQEQNKVARNSKPDVSPERSSDPRSRLVSASYISHKRESFTLGGLSLKQPTLMKAAHSYNTKLDSIAIPLPPPNSISRHEDLDNILELEGTGKEESDAVLEETPPLGQFKFGTSKSPTKSKKSRSMTISS